MGWACGLGLSPEVCVNVGRSPGEAAWSKGSLRGNRPTTTDRLCLVSTGRAMVPHQALCGYLGCCSGCCDCPPLPSPRPQCLLSGHTQPLRLSAYKSVPVTCRDPYCLHSQLPALRPGFQGTDARSLHTAPRWLELHLAAVVETEMNWLNRGVCICH